MKLMHNIDELKTLPKVEGSFQDDFSGAVRTSFTPAHHRVLTY